MSRDVAVVIRTIFLGGLLAGVVSACGQSVQNGPVTRAADLCQTNFTTCVMPIFINPIRRSDMTLVTCNASSCHALLGNGGNFTLLPDPVKNYQVLQNNFTNFLSPDDSQLLAEPLRDSVTRASIAGIVTFHGGGDIFPSEGDLCYQAIRSWIAEQVTNQATCSVCTAIANPTASCGY
jgi:hypothetical protein